MKTNQKVTELEKHLLAKFVDVALERAVLRMREDGFLPADFRVSYAEWLLASDARSERKSMLIAHVKRELNKVADCARTALKLEEDRQRRLREPQVITLESAKPTICERVRDWFAGL